MRHFAVLRSIYWSLVAFVLWAVLCTTHTHAQQSTSGDNRTFFFDVLCFKGSSDTTQRIDVFTVVPYASLTFIKRNNTFIANYKLTVTLRSKDGAVRSTVVKEYPLAEERAEATTGITGAFDYAQIILQAPPGAYTIQADIEDVLGKRTMNRTRGLTTIDFDSRDLSLSSLMFSSAVAQNGQRYAVTPYLDDDVAALATETFFVFFESYFRSQSIDSVDFVYELLDARNNRAALGKRTRRFVKADRVQQFLKIDVPASVAVGNYSLRVMALRPDSTVLSGQIPTRDIFAATTRALRIEWKGLGFGTALQGDELLRAVRQLRYVAPSAEIQAMQNAPNDEERQKRFYEFWKKTDPTPATPRNEAYDEYYGRVDFANRTFRHHTEGWMTDMGMVYVIFGPPPSANEQRRIDGRTLVSWFYPSFGREFVFMDNGFGDFRLITPMPVERYRYRR